MKNNSTLLLSNGLDLHESGIDTYPLITVSTGSSSSGFYVYTRLKI